MEMTPSKDHTPLLHVVVETRADEENTMKLYEAAHRGCKATLNSLVQKDPLILNKVSLTSFSETPLHISALLGHLDFTKALLSKKSKLTTELDSLKRSPLHLASAEGHAEIVKALLYANKDACLVLDQDGRIPLHLAVMRGRIKVIQELIDARQESIRVHLEGDTVLHLCVRYNHLEALKLLVTMVEDDEFLNSRNHEGNTILHSAVMLKQLETTKFLYSLPEVKARANALSGMGFTTLDVLEHSPRDLKSLEIRDILIEAGVRRAKDLNTLTPSSPPIVVVNTKTQSTKSRCSRWMNYLKYKGNWVEETQGTLMLVATVIATMAFQAATNPPGGVWQDDLKQNNYTCPQGDFCLAGTAVWAFTNPPQYHVFVITNAISFVASLSVVLLVISGFPAKNKVCMWLLTVAMILSVSSMTYTFLLGFSAVTPDSSAFSTALTSLYIWMGLLAVVGLFHTIRLVYWLVRKLRKFTSKT